MKRAMPHPRWRPLFPGIIGLAVLLTGCAGFSPDGGMNAAQDIAGSELGKDVAALRTPEDAEVARGAVRRLLRRPVTVDAAVQVALLNNRDLQAAYSELGISEAALVKASLPPNPTFSVSDIAGGGAFEFERVVVVSILALATLPARAEIAGDRFHQAQLKAALETLRVAAQTRRAYYQAVAARTLARFLEEATASAENAAQISRRLGESGALNKLDQARDQVFYADLTAETASARRRVIYKKVQDILLRDLPMLPLWHPDNVVVMRRGVQGYRLWPSAQLSGLSTVYKTGAALAEP